MSGDRGPSNGLAALGVTAVVLVVWVALYVVVSLIAHGEVRL